MFRKLLILLLDDEHGITDEAYQLVSQIASEHEDVGDIIQAVKATEGRVYLPEGWE